MLAINSLLKQISDVNLRKRLENEFSKLSKNKKFGFVFEDHISEYTQLYGVTVQRGSNVVYKTGTADDIYMVLSITNGLAKCVNMSTEKTVEFPLDDLIAVTRFGDPIFPTLRPIDSIAGAPDSKLWHTLIESENYHALQLLEYLYPQQVDCIYIDPPYNTGAKDWKYNDIYVDSSDNWRHSKWLSMMQKRLQLAKRILTENGVIVISISYHELNHLMLLCEDIFPKKQVVSVTVQTSGGKPRGGFRFQHEYLIFVAPTEFAPHPTSFAGGRENSPFHNMTLTTFTPAQRPNQVYPIFVDRNTKHITGCGISLAERVKQGGYTSDLADFEFNYDEAPEGAVAIWPVSSTGAKCVWRLVAPHLLENWKKGYIKVVPQKTRKNRNEFSVQFLSAGIISKIESGAVKVVGTEADAPTVVLDTYRSEGGEIPTIWTERAFYTAHGTRQLQNIFGTKEFSYPKPLDLITEILRTCTRQDSLIVDFFAGSGTTLHAVNLLNTEDGGRRRCIMITNNEVSEAEAKLLRKGGYRPGDPEWEKHGICRAVTWPRTRFTVLGQRDDGTPLPGEYAPGTSGERRLMRDGLPANVEYFQLEFLNRDDVLLGRNLRELLPLLWLKVGAVGARPECQGGACPAMLIFPENGFAVLAEETEFACFAEKLAREEGIGTVYFVTNSEEAFREMSERVRVPRTYQLYRDYIDAFELRTGRG